MEPILVVMAAGMGSRYGGAKQIDPISNEGDIIMDFSLYDAYQAGFRRVVFIIKKDFEESFRQHMDARAGKRYETHFVFQEMTDLPEGFTLPEGRTKPWGTSHAVLAARNVIDAPFAVINADDFYGKEAFQEIYKYLVDQADATHHCMVGFSIENTLSDNGTVSRGICRVENGKLSSVEEHHEVGYREDRKIYGRSEVTGETRVIPEGTPVSMNLFGFGKEFIRVLQGKLVAALQDIEEKNPLKGEALLPSMVDEEIHCGNASMEVLRSGDKWYGVTYREDRDGVIRALAEKKAKGDYPLHLWDE